MARTGYVVKITTGGEIIPAESGLTLKEMQSYVGGIIQYVPTWRVSELMDGAEIYCNEEGLIYSLPLNDIVSRFAEMPILGDCVVTRINADGDDVGFTKTEADEVANKIRMLTGMEVKDAR